MGLSVIARGATAPTHAPVFSNLVHTQNLEFCLRANSTLNAFDLSDKNRAVSAPVGAGVYTQNGLSVNGLGGVNVPDLRMAEYTNYTLMGVFFTGADIDYSAVSNPIVLAGDWRGTGAGRNASTTIVVEKAADTNPEIRVYFGSKDRNNADRALNFSRIRGLPATHFVKTGNMVRLKPMFVAASIFINTTTNTGRTSLYLKSEQSNELIGNVFNPNSVPNMFLAADKLAQQPLGVEPFRVGYLNDTFDKGTFKHIKEVRFDSAELTSAQIEDQYQATKKWLLAEGVVDISHWR